MADKTVLEVFKKFDTDSTGDMSRAGLGQVLQALKETDPWGDEEIDEILAAADASGDGKLQLEEFVRWVFAQDKEISQGVKAKAVLKISGCSREEFNGDYVQKEEEFYYRRPIFSCKENGKVLFYHEKRGQWQLYSRTGSKASCRILTSRTAHMPGEGKTWAVWKKKSSKSKKKAFVREPDMKCEAEVTEVPERENAEELLQQAEPSVKFDEIYYKKIEGVIGNRAVYRQSKGESDWGDTYLFYEKSETKWKRATEAKEGASALNLSRDTKEPSPERATWLDEIGGGVILVLSIDTDGIPNSTGQKLTLNPNVSEGWKDPSYPHNEDSIGKDLKSVRARWLRALALHKTPVLFADLEPADCLQGSTGNCWFVAALAGLAEFPAYLKNNIMLNKKVSKDGRYHIKVFDGVHRRWKVIELDDYLPCTTWGGNRPSLYFGKINDGKLCYALIEKAFAKVYGSYANLQGGWQMIAWYHLTGCSDFFQYYFSYSTAVKWVVDADDGIPVYSDKKKSQKLGVLPKGAFFKERSRTQSWIHFVKAGDSDGPSSGWLQYYNKGKRVASRSPLYPPKPIWRHYEIKGETVMMGIRGYRENKIGSKDDSPSGFDYAFKLLDAKFVSFEGVWRALLKYDKANHLMASGASYSANQASCGIVHRHAYSVLKAVEVGGIRLVSLRNPWGNEAEWNGPWSDRSAEWRNNPGIAEALNVDYQTDGTFWMDFEDFMYVFGRLQVMNCQMPTSRGDFHAQFVDNDVDGSGDEGDDDEDDDDGPGGDIWISKPKTGGKIVALSGLGVDWNGPALMQDGTFLHPGDSEATFQNVPSYLNGATYFGHPMEVSAGNGTIQFEPPTTMYFWLKDGYTNSLELVLPTCGWKEESAPGFQTSDGSKLMVFSKYFEEADKYSGCYESFRTISSYFCGGVVGVYPLPKEPKMVDSESAKPDAEFILEGEPPESGGGVTSCSGLDIEWNAPAKIAEGTLVNPGERNFFFENVPSFMSGGTYIGSKTWPSPGTWTINYKAPTTLYVWVEAGEYNAGVDDALSADGWHREEVGEFQRVGDAGVNPLGVWSRQFHTGSTYSIVTNGLVVGGVVSSEE